MAVLSTAMLLLLATALPASAHVEVSSPDATPGDEGTIVFRVPTESATASTTKLTVTMPVGTPFAEVSTKPHPGWRVSTTERRLAKPIKSEGFTLTKVVGSVTWTAVGKGLGPGQFDEFELSVGPFPDKPATFVMPAVQTYSNGQVVRWDEPTPAGGREPEHPAPTLHVPATAPAGATDASSSTDRAATPGSSDGIARWLGAGGLVLGALALVTAVVLGRRKPARAAVDGRAREDHVV